MKIFLVNICGGLFFMYICKIKLKIMRKIFKRFLAVIAVVLYILLMITVTISQYWLTHWIIFGKNVYYHVAEFCERNHIGDYESN